MAGFRRGICFAVEPMMGGVTQGLDGERQQSLITVNEGEIRRNLEAMQQFIR
jgi:hypothetical protein